MIAWPSKDPQDVADYYVDWTATLTPDADTIASSTFTVTDGSVAIAPNPAPAIAGMITSLWLTGGVLGERCRIVNHIVTAGGREWDQTVALPIRER